MLSEEGTSADDIDRASACIHTAARQAYLQALGEGGVDIRGCLKSCQLSEGGIGVMDIQVQGGPPTPTPEGSGG